MINKSLVMEAAVNLIEEIEKGQFLLILLEEEAYMDKMAEMAKSMARTKKKICYVCLSKPYMDVANDLRSRGIDVKEFHFIDVLSSHYGKRRPTDNCTFLDSPTDLADIRVAISNSLKEKKCSVVVFDTISTMLIYQETSKIVRFTHDFLSEERERNKILYLVLKHDSIPVDESERLLSDLKMFADRTINFNKKSDI